MPVVAGMGAILAALIAGLLLYASFLLVKFIAGLIPGDLPVIGSRLRDAVVSLADWALQSISSVMRAAMRPLGDLWNGLVARAYTFVDRTIGALYAAAAALHALRTYFLPLVLNQAKAFAASIVAKAITLLSSAIAAARTYARQLATFAEAYAAGLVRNAVAALTSLINAARTYAAELAHFAEAYAAGLVRNAVAALTSLLSHAVAALQTSIRAVESFAHAAYADTLGRIAAMGVALEHFATHAAAAAAAESVAVLEAGIHAGLSDVWPGVRAGVDAVEGVIATDFPDILAGLKDISLDIPKDAAAAITAAGALSIPMLRFMERCGVPNCRNLSALGRDLQALLGLVEDVAFLGLVTELIHNPKAAAADFEATVGGLATETLDGALSVLGLA